MPSYLFRTNPRVNCKLSRLVNSLINVLEVEKFCANGTDTASFAGNGLSCCACADFLIITFTTDLFRRNWELRR